MVEEQNGERRIEELGYVMNENSLKKKKKKEKREIGYVMCQVDSQTTA